METPVNHEEIDWSMTTFDGVRLRQMREFAALTFREKMLVIEGISELAERLQSSLKPTHPTSTEGSAGPANGVSRDR